MKPLFESFNSADFELPGNRMYLVINLTKHYDDIKGYRKKTITRIYYYPDKDKKVVFEVFYSLEEFTNYLNHAI